ncbi:MAG: hypothetical protein IPF82_07530 [Blastocatellia bacterium]|nr:hypothetical protein [Blastocatellia bacterium]
MRALLIIGILVTIANVSVGLAGQGEPPGMARYQVVLLKAGPKWNANRDEARHRLMGEHLAYFRDLVKAGTLVAVGPTTSQGDVKGVLILRGTTEEATALASADPAVKAGELVPETRPWLGTAGIGDGYAARAAEKRIEDIPMESLQLGLLWRGPSWTPEKTPEIEKLQASHLAHIGEMAKSGKLVVAGPFLEGGNLRGIFLFRCSADEAVAMASKDPMVQAGRLKLEFHTWSVNVGVIPEAKPH